MVDQLKERLKEIGELGNLSEIDSSDLLGHMAKVIWTKAINGDRTCLGLLSDMYATVAGGGESAQIVDTLREAFAKIHSGLDGETGLPSEPA